MRCVRCDRCLPIDLDGFCGPCSSPAVSTEIAVDIRGNAPLTKLNLDGCRAAVRTLQGQGYTWHGGTHWKPPLGKPVNFNLLDERNARIAELEAERDALRDKVAKWDAHEAAQKTVTHYPVSGVTVYGLPPLPPGSHEWIVDKPTPSGLLTEADQDKRGMWGAE